MLTSGVLSLGKDDPISPESLVAQARKLQDVWSDGTPAVKVRTEIETLDERAKRSEDASEARMCMGRPNFASHIDFLLVPQERHTFRTHRIVKRGIHQVDCREDG